MAAPSSMCFQYVDRVFMGVHTADAPRDDEWEHHCQNLERERTRVLGVLVYTDGGGPSSQQRRLLRDAFRDSTPPYTAIITSSVFVRGIITSLNWFADNRLAAFEPDDLDGALRYLARAGAVLDRRTVVATLTSIANSLSLRLPTKWSA